jgi:hypothetical protein
LSHVKIKMSNIIESIRKLIGSIREPLHSLVEGPKVDEKMSGS